MQSFLLIAVAIVGIQAIPAPVGLWEAKNFAAGSLPNTGTSPAVMGLQQSQSGVTVDMSGPTPALAFPDVASTVLTASYPPLTMPSLLAPTSNAYSIEAVATVTAGTIKFENILFVGTDLNILIAKGHGLSCITLPTYKGWTAGVGDTSGATTKATETAGMCNDGGTYHHYVMTVDPTSPGTTTDPIVSLYIDGNFISSKRPSTAHSGSTVAQIVNGDHLYTVMGPGPISIRYTAFYDATLSASDVSKLHKSSMKNQACVGPPEGVRDESCYHGKIGESCLNNRYMCTLKGWKRVGAPCSFDVDCGDSDLFCFNAHCFVNACSADEACCPGGRSCLPTGNARYRCCGKSGKSYAWNAEPVTLEEETHELSEIHETP